MSWTGLFYRIATRRWWALVGLVAACLLILATTRPLNHAALPRLWDIAVIALIIWSGVLMTWRAADERATRRRLAQRRVEWRATCELMAARVLAFIVPTRDDDAPETDELKATLSRRHMALTAAAAALDEGGDPAAQLAVLSHSTAIERQDLQGAALVARLAGLQRDALVEAERRQWLTAGRFTALEENLCRMNALPSPDKSWTSGYTRLSTVVVTGTAWLLPFAAPARISGLAVAAAIGLLLIAFDALSD